MSDFISPNDLPALILKYLPVKSLLRFRSVSKSWKNLISSQSFITSHLSLQNPQPFFTQPQILHELASDPQLSPFLERIHLPHDNNHKPRPVASLHGIICLYCDTATDLLFLWNPSIRQIIRVPNSPEFPNQDAFKICGFWIDPSTNHFKIALLCIQLGNAAVFSSIRNSWTRLSLDWGDEFNKKVDILQEDESMMALESGIHPLDRNTQLLLNGKAHWIVYRAYEFGDIVTFDFEKEEVGYIDLDEGMVSNCALSVCKWEGNLSVITLDEYCYNVCELWAVINGRFAKMMSCCLPDRILDAYCVLESCGRVFGRDKHDQLVLFDLKDRERRIDVICVIAVLDIPTFLYDFVESLVFPDPNWPFQMLHL